MNRVSHVEKTVVAGEIRCFAFINVNILPAPSKTRVKGPGAGPEPQLFPPTY